MKETLLEIDLKDPFGRDAAMIISTIRGDERNFVMDILLTGTGTLENQDFIKIKRWSTPINITSNEPQHCVRWLRIVQSTFESLQSLQTFF